jgi:hypothetical protein
MKSTACCPTHAVGCRLSLAYAYASPRHEFMSISAGGATGVRDETRQLCWWPEGGGGGG